jgi:hypothetical protein
MQHQHTIQRHDAPWIGGLVLVAVGLLMLATYLVPEIGLYTVLVLGIVFLAAFLYTRAYGFLVPGGILTGLGIGIILTQAMAAEEMLAGAVVVGGLALGFAAIWAIAALMHLEESHPWPLIPAAILGTVAVFLAIGQPEALQYLSVVIAIAMIAGGGWLMLRRRGGGGQQS